ncbi:Tellurite methyltransferase [Sphingomonas sp. EC-HK361]|uniref:class I SAM-dependent methyltransferase n=1 Tax=Sphingomonas sp. EC-HK361 TaxID=2038397 RepID=UPI001254D77C|nr:class I SAM-dependent methyltransferase [Sphingomonas sp. EC-HK361]VVT10236.1 Tellurite methyltransferase [Sphingomonas sp. EC-HK361]
MALSDRLDAPDYYDRDAVGFAARYNSVSFEAVHPLLLRYLPATGRALDVGAGSGRDARAMAKRGMMVTAVEPSDGLRAIAAANSAGIRWIDDRLPHLSRLAGEAGQYDFVLCSAVLMLVPSGDLAPSLTAMAALLGEGGRLGLNLRAPRSGEPADLFFDHRDDAVLAAAEAAGLACLDWGEDDDAIGRGGYRWRSFVFEFLTKPNGETNAPAR